MKQGRIAKRKQSLEIRKASSEKTSTSETSHSFLDSPDDTKDGDHGTHASSGCKVASIRIASGSSGTSLAPGCYAATPRKTSIVPVKRRSSVTASGPVEKRSRQSIKLNNENDGGEVSPKNPDKGSQQA